MNRKKAKSYKWVELAIVVWTLVCVLAMTAVAAQTSTYSCFQLSAQSNGEVEITATPTGWSIKAYGTNGDCGATNTETVTFTITNTETKPDGTPRAVNFKITTTGMGTNDTGAAKTLDASTTSHTYTATSGKGSSESTTITISFADVMQESMGANVITTVKPGTGGTIKVDGTAVTSQTDFSNLDSHTYTLTATADPGYKFYGWMSATGMLTTNGATTYSYPGQNAATLWPMFIKDDSALYYVVGETPTMHYGYLNEALAAAGSSGTVVVHQSGTAYHSDPTQNSFTIESGVTLLVPFDAAATTGVVNRTSETEDLPMNMYRKLTLPSGSSLTVNGTLNVNGQQGFFLAIMQGATVGDYGCLEMKSGSSITVNGTLRARGLIIGDDKMVDWENRKAAITVNSGATVYQSFQTNDFRGGSYSLTNQNSATFLVNQFYIQNIQVGTSYASGSKLIGQYYVYASEGFSGEATVIGTDANCLFKLSSGKLYMSYDGNESKSIIDVAGSVDVQHISISLKFYVTITLDTAKSILPLFGGFSINARDGATINVNYDAKLLPGCVITIDDGATLNVNKALYLYDTADYLQGYSGYSYGYYRLRANSNSLTGMTVQRNSSNGPEAYSMALLPETTTDGGLVVNGTVNINSGGALYTSLSAGSNGNYPLSTTADTGRIIVKAASSATKSITELNQSADSKPSITFNAAQGVYATTKKLGSIAGTTGTYKSTGSAWYNWQVTVKGENGATVATYYLMNGDALPATEGYEHYYADAAYTTEVTVDTAVKEDMTLYLHKHEYTEEVTAPTCTEAGYTTYTCAACGDSYTANEVAALGHTYDSGKITTDPNGDTPSVMTYTCTGCGDTYTEKVLFQQSTQLGLKEPWFMKSNLYIKVGENYMTQEQLNALVDYGVYFVRASELGITGTSVMPDVQTIIDHAETVHYSKSSEQYPAGIEEGEAGYMITASYVKGIYTYELADPVYVLYYIEDAAGVHYAEVKLRNLYEIADAAQTNTKFTETEQAVYTCMVTMYDTVTAHRATFVSIPEMSVHKAPAVTTVAFGEYVEDCKVAHSVNVVLIEPWGLRLNGYVNETVGIQDCGVVVFYDKNGIYSEAPTVAQLIANEGAYVFSTSNGNATATVIGEDTKITADYTKDVYTYQLDDKAYAVFFVKIDGVYHFGEVKTRTVLEQIEKAQVSAIATETEKAVYAAMLDMYTKVTAHRATFDLN